jgi:hypothetical protein
MTGTQISNAIKEAAIDLLLAETFGHIQKEQFEQYVSLATKNSHIHKKPNKHFCFDGVIYPPASTEKGHSTISLHFSLLSELDRINNLLTDNHYRSIKNYFIAVISASCNALVLTELLPTVLLDTLKTNLSLSEFRLLDDGLYSNKESTETTLLNIQYIKKFYPAEINYLQQTLMNKLLLQ